MFFLGFGFGSVLEGDIFFSGGCLVVWVGSFGGLFGGVKICLKIFCWVLIVWECLEFFFLCVWFWVVGDILRAVWVFEDASGCCVCFGGVEHNFQDLSQA